MVKCHTNTADQDQSGPFPPEGSTLSGFWTGKLSENIFFDGNLIWTSNMGIASTFSEFGLWRPRWRFPRHGSWKCPWSGSDIMQEAFPPANTNHVESMCQSGFLQGMDPRKLAALANCLACLLPKARFATVELNRDVVTSSHARWLTTLSCLPLEEL